MPSLIGECELVYTRLSYIILLAVGDELRASRRTESQMDGALEIFTSAAGLPIDWRGWEGKKGGGWKGGRHQKGKVNGKGRVEGESGTEG